MAIMARWIGKNNLEDDLRRMAYKIDHDLVVIEIGYISDNEADAIRNEAFRILPELVHWGWGGVSHQNQTGSVQFWIPRTRSNVIHNELLDFRRSYRNANAQQAAPSDGEKPSK